MKSFLKDIANHLYNSFGNELHEVCLVFPNQRAGLFLKKYLSELVPNPVWSPQIYTISDLMAELADLSLADDLYLLFELYDIYCAEKKSNESFDNFYFWGEILLGDFDDIDKYLVNAKDLFRNLSALKSIEEEISYLSEEQVSVIKQFWQSFIPSGSEQSGEPDRQLVSGLHQKDWLSTWEILYKIYWRLRERLIASKLGYEGMIYRRVAEMIDQESLHELSCKRIFFIGFNALNECEKSLFRYFKKSGKAEFFWDFDDLYVNEKDHEAGRFIRKNIKEFGISEHIIPRDNLLQKKDINIISVPGEVGQAKILPGLLSEINDTTPETAIVLADEKLLLPVMHSLPGSVREFNITMGYPLQETQLYSLLGHIIRLQEKARENDDGSWKFYYHDVLAILNHPSINSGYEDDFRKLIDQINIQNLIFVHEKLLNNHPFLKSVFKKIKDQSDLLSYLLNILEAIARKYPGQGTQSQDKGKQSGEGKMPVNDDQSRALENEIIFQLFIKIKRLDEILRGRKVELRINTLYQLIRKILMNTSIPFSGEPLSGLQIMGVLETRVLDFRNLVILSMNEGVFPKSPVKHSFIPHNLRYGFNLPTVEHHDAIYSYYFYRLIQRAEKIVMIFNSKTEGITSGEQSRFLHQLVFDKRFSAEEKVIAYNIQANPEKPLTILKDDRIIRLLNKYIKGVAGHKYLSSTALNMYLDCSLKFYFSFIAGLEEPLEIKEEIDPQLFGNLLHSAVNKLYESFGSELISAELLKILHSDKEKIAGSVIHAFREAYQKAEDPALLKIEGRNAIIHDILVTYLKQIISRDINYSPFRILEREKKIIIGLPVNIEDSRSDVAVGGKIDRIDRTGDLARIIDYKTGRVILGIESIESLFDSGNKNRNSEVFQVLLYAKLIHSSRPELNEPVVPGLYPIMDLNSDDFDYHIKVGLPNKKESLEDFRIYNAEFTLKLTELVAEIFDRKVSFLQTSIADRCRFCPYRRICHR